MLGNTIVNLFKNLSVCQMKPHDKTAQILDDLLGVGSSPSPPTSPTTQTNDLSPPPSIDIPPPSNAEQSTEVGIHHIAYYTSSLQLFVIQC